MRLVSSVPSRSQTEMKREKKLNFHCSIDNDNYDIFWVNTLSYRLNVICCCHRWHMFFLFYSFVLRLHRPNENGVLACERIVLCRCYVVLRRRCCCCSYKSTYCNPVESCNRIGQFALTFAFCPLLFGETEAVSVSVCSRVSADNLIAMNFFAVALVFMFTCTFYANVSLSLSFSMCAPKCNCSHFIWSDFGTR